MRTRSFPEKNYKAIYHDGKTLRMALDPKSPILELEYPEFYDISLGTYCAGECPYCYQNGSRQGKVVEDPCERLQGFYGPLNANQRPFQVALSGVESVKDSVRVLKTLTDLGIVPNYTSNGIYLSDELLGATKQYCGGVAITAHPHLQQYWLPAVEKLLGLGIFVNIHVLIHDRESILQFLTLYRTLSPAIKYFVLLPIINQGRASGYKIDSEFLFKEIKSLVQEGRIAFGANFYEQLKNTDFEIYLYEPEIFSKYLDLMTMKVYKSSFSVEEE
jgi:sulfatase maturation enzyme AslB (radical SAM superfamily)